LGVRLYRRAVVDENRCRAARRGLDGRLVDFGRRGEAAVMQHPIDEAPERGGTPVRAGW